MLINYNNSVHFQLMQLIKKMHSKCRSETYPFSKVKRLVFPQNLIPWSVGFQDYNPPEYESDVLLNKPWADPPITDSKFKPNWNNLDGAINRKSHLGPYSILNARPLNPIGRTGLKGRGVLGKWGPNHAADPIVTRWKSGTIDKDSEPTLQFCAIQRKDCGQWALPGGMVDPGEKVSETLRREFMEEALNSLEATPDFYKYIAQKRLDEAMIKAFFSSGQEIYKGYVDDPRNTDNAWMETVAVNFHDSDNSCVGKFALKAGDDAAQVQWMDVDQNLDLYASHSELLKTVAQRLGAHW